MKGHVERQCKTKVRQLTDGTAKRDRYGRAYLVQQQRQQQPPVAQSNPPPAPNPSIPPMQQQPWYGPPQANHVWTFQPQPPAP
jgi:hypothetical protein